MEEDKSRRGELIAVWEQTIEVQKHFNDIEMKIRNYAITLLLAVLGAAGIAMREGARLHVSPFDVSWAILALAFMLLAWCLIYWLAAKRWYYLIVFFMAACGAVISLARQWTLQIGAFDASLASLVLLSGLIAWGLFYMMDGLWYHRLLVGAVNQGLAIEERLFADLPGKGLTHEIGDESPFKLLGVGREFHSEDKLRVFYFGGACVLVVLAIVAQIGITDAAAP